MNIASLLFLIPLACFLNGLQELYVVLTNWEATEMSYKEYILKGSSAKWLKLNNCYIDNEEVIVVHKYGAITENDDFFIPVRSDTDKISESSVSIFLKVNSKHSKVIFSKLFNLQKDERKFKEYFSSHPREFEFLALKYTASIEGKVLFGIESKAKVRNLLENKGKATSNFIIIDENKEPSIIFLYIGSVEDYFHVFTYGHLF